MQWTKRFILFHGEKNPGVMGAREINEFLTHLAVERQVSASTQSQALAAILFLYRDVLGEEVPWPLGAGARAAEGTDTGGAELSSEPYTRPCAGRA